MTDAARQVRVVLVDDHPYALEGNTLLLDTTDDILVVGGAGSGEDALEIVGTTQPDVVVMDVRMPGMGGIEATRQIVTRYPAIRVIVLTTFDIDEYAFGGLDAGASAFLLKSSPVDTLARAIRIVAGGEAIVEPRITKRLVDLYTRRIEPAPELSSNADPRKDVSVLSPREQEVFYAIAQGLSNPEICSRYHLSPATVKTHVNRIFSKLGFRDRAQAIIYAHRHGLDG